MANGNQNAKKMQRKCKDGKQREREEEKNFQNAQKKYEFITGRKFLPKK